jgi:ERCC4-type nuclease
MATEHHQEHQENEAAPAPIIHILADDREIDRGVIQALQQTPGVEVQAQRLLLGDYEVDAGCCSNAKRCWTSPNLSRTAGCSRKPIDSLTAAVSSP